MANETDPVDITEVVESYSIALTDTVTGETVEWKAADLAGQTARIAYEWDEEGNARLVGMTWEWKAQSTGTYTAGAFGDGANHDR